MAYNGSFLCLQNHEKRVWVALAPTTREARSPHSMVMQLDVPSVYNASLKRILNCSVCYLAGDDEILQ